MKRSWSCNAVFAFVVGCVSCALLMSEAGDAGDAGEMPIEGMVLIKGGTFTMGSIESASVLERGERPPHEVSISAFYMGMYEVTQAEWVAVMGTNPSRFKGDALPVEQVSWYDCVAYCNKKSIQDGLRPCYSKKGETNPDTWDTDFPITCDFSANGYRLPTEAEWEYVCRAGTTTAYNTGSTITVTQANFLESRLGQTTKVGSYAPNAWGLYDMHGNVWEWCWDWFSWDYYATSPKADPPGASSGDGRVVRGGCWFSDAGSLRSADRGRHVPEGEGALLGFRLVCRP